jgi:hypothetical protein
MASTTRRHGRRPLLSHSEANTSRFRVRVNSAGGRCRRPSRSQRCSMHANTQARRASRAIRKRQRTSVQRDHDGSSDRRPFSILPRTSSDHGHGRARQATGHTRRRLRRSLALWPDVASHAVTLPQLVRSAVQRKARESSGPHSAPLAAERRLGHRIRQCAVRIGSPAASTL